VYIISASKLQSAIGQAYSLSSRSTDLLDGESEGELSLVSKKRYKNTLDSDSDTAVVSSY